MRYLIVSILMMNSAFAGAEYYACTQARSGGDMSYDISIYPPSLTQKLEVVHLADQVRTFTSRAHILKARKTFKGFIKSKAFDVLVGDENYSRMDGINGRLRGTKVDSHWSFRYQPWRGNHDGKGTFYEPDSDYSDIEIYCTKY
jgi:hypothetical protein